MAQQSASVWMDRAHTLHRRYMEQAQNKQQTHLHDELDALAYLGLRASATYAQIFGAVAAVAEIMPSWQPQTLLDLGSGPGTGVWALSSLLPSLAEATCIDQNAHLLALGQKIISDAQLPVIVTWQQGDVIQPIERDETQYDLIVVANVLNELNAEQREKLLETAFKRCRQLMIVVEPGTPIGSAIAQAAAAQLAPAGRLIAPYIDNNFVEEYFLHFPQRFTRPEFARRIRQEMRDSPLMASDWEEAKYSYVAVGKIPPEETPWGRCIGPIRLMNGYLELPMLLKDQVVQLKVMKRHKQQYAFAKKLRWGQLVMQREALVHPSLG
ncbi:MAG: methyltransferase domain-containing protein [Chloroflexi bacterium]|nr:methyltransferase domain-containing protein [Chloroflexota bacterium]